jgi:hypothetical protein
MNKFAALLTSALVAIAAAPSAASAAITITDVGVGNGYIGDVSVSGYGTPWATPILLTDSHGNSYFTYCGDLDHTIGVGGGQSLPYHLGLLTANGLGQPLTEAVSNEIGQIAGLGHRDYLHGDVDGQVAAQAAIWQLEYGGVSINPDLSHPDIEQDFHNFLTNVHDNGHGWAEALISERGNQNLVLGVPEPATWTSMILGFALIGAASRRRAVSAAG